MAASKYCGWEADIQFVLEVEKRPCLYDKRLKDYRNQYSRQMAWKEISQMFHIPEQGCLVRWKAIRDKYLKIYKKNGSGADATIEDPAWIVSKYLSFLNPCLKPKRNKVKYAEFLSLESPQISQPEPSVHEDTPVSGTGQEILESNALENENVKTLAEIASVGHDYRCVETASPSSDMTDSAATASEGVVPGKRKHRKRAQRNAMEKVLEVLKAPIVVPSHEPRDADEMFLLSLLPEFKQLNARKKNKVKIRMLQLFEEEEQEQENG